MSTKNFVRGAITGISLYALVLMQVIFAPIGGFAANPTAAPAAIIYDNGGFATGATSKSGVAAPAGSQWSEISTENGTNFSNTTLGIGCQTIGTTTGNRCADDFVVPAGQTWTINNVIVFGYQTNSTTNPFIGANLRIWNGRPGDAGSTIVFGDTTTNRIGSVTDTSTYRVGNTLGGAGGVTAATTNTARKIWQIPITVSPGLALTSGVYWIDFSLDAGANGNFSPPKTIVGARSLPDWNMRQFISTTATWADVVDIGEPAVTTGTQPDVVPNVILEFPFKLDGSVSGATFAPAARKLDFDGDGRTDFAIARSADAVSPTTWWIQNSSGTQIVYPLGTGVGFASGDKATPADWDGDGKTDIAVWRSGPALTAGFYILQSNNTIRFEQFGQTGDDPSIVADYDGDGKADPAVYRPGATGTFYFRASTDPAGHVTVSPFWGVAGDIALPGDMNGDGLADYNIVRNNGGLAEHWTRFNNNAGTRTFQYGLATDKFVTGDFDADGRTDICAVRANGSVYDWYALRSATNSVLQVQFGNPATDFLTPGDYDGDNKTDFVVWRSGQAADQTYFYMKGTNSATATREWGQSSGANTVPDYPVANWNVK
ncbi:MAG TPA: VCBS repeat-containing protein [Pyrinomonadaceae bacterium]|jgi:hypothetical protein